MGDSKGPRFVEILVQSTVEVPSLHRDVIGGSRTFGAVRLVEAQACKAGGWDLQ